MAEAQQLSVAHCVLLAVHYATESNVIALRTLTASRQDAFDPELTLRIILTYLPESAEPSSYTTYIHEFAARINLDERENDVSLDVSPVKELSDTQARKKLHKLHLLPLVHRSCPPDSLHDPLTLFLIHRAHRIDQETGLLDFVPQLVVPFLSQSEYLRTWFISTALPLLRLGYEYYPQTSIPSLEAFDRLNETKAVETLLSNHEQSQHDIRTETDTIGRDIRGLIGPWMYGHNERKRRKLNKARRQSVVDGGHERSQGDSLDGASTSHELGTNEDWDCLFTWLIRTASKNFPLVISAIRNWDGPGDVDLGGYENGHEYLSEELQGTLELRYAQSALASVYAVDADAQDTIEGAHSLLVRLANLLDFETPPDLTTNIDLFPKFNSSNLPEISTAILQPETLLQPDNPLTRPELQTFQILQMLVYSAYLLAGLHHTASIKSVAKLRFNSDSEEQFSLLQKMLHALASGPRKSDEQWASIRDRLIWLWAWGMDMNETTSHGFGVFGKIERSLFESEILKALLEGNHYTLAVRMYLQSPEQHHHLSMDNIEKVVLASAMQHYDNASNGNRTRGGMKKASDIISTFSPYFPTSVAFRRSKALLSATHALSFYSLTLQHGVPFQPVNIRVSTDPLSLLERVLDQNPRSYTHLDDLISIGQNLVISSPSSIGDEASDLSAELLPADLEQRKSAAEHRIIGMAIEAALAEDDFETAYSYVVNRLPPPSAPPYLASASSPSSRRPSVLALSSHRRQQAKDEDDVSWRAAFLAGRHESSSPSESHVSTGSSAPPGLRRLEQRLELLSQALLLAPSSHLPEVLDVWQQCEAKMMTVLAHEIEVDQRFDDQADRKLPGAFMNETVAIQPRREVGRGAVEEAPMGLFDVARGAAAAFSRSAFPLRGASIGGVTGSGDGSRGKTGTGDGLENSRMSSDFGSEAESVGGSEEGGRVRKRDMVANAVTGGLASGLGWVLGATPVQNQGRE
ncbi:secretory pathway Sec39 [Glonium stellatum]|uniref:Secretory pathway Sec39 n=1 Tax=Glonium stellatum TaxID=574774 RepID=A0A8E2JTE9_9PEZI|nr:secretory pathway Sec39 [Glonium stellatum]